MKTRSVTLSVVALAALSLSALTSSQASAWGSREYGYGGYRSMGYFGHVARGRSWGSEPCPSEYAPVLRHRRMPRFTYAEAIPCEEEAPATRSFETRGYASERITRGYASTRQAQGYGPPRQTPGYAPQPKFDVPESRGPRDVGQTNRQDAYEQAPGPAAQMPQQHADPVEGPAEYSSKELQR
jgi:hypothetical protein